MKALLFASASVGALIMAAPVSAQTDSSQPAEERVAQARDIITVTATRREESLQDVPLSITTFSQDELDARGIVGYEGLAFETPGVVLNRASANFNNFTARGIATNGYNANLQSAVAIYVDELPISSNGNSTILDPSLYDVERIEFLRGPQGTLFGSGSLAGALRIITHAPNPNAFEFSALADIGVTGSDSLRQRYNAMVNIPLVEDQLALRIVGHVRDEEGYIDNIGTGIDNANALESWGGRATLLWQPTDRMSIQLRVSHEDSNPQDSSIVNPTLGRDKRISDRPDRFAGVMTNYNATVRYQFEGAELVSSSTWSEYEAQFYVDLAGTFGELTRPIPFALDADGWDETFVQEIRLVSDAGGRFDWVIGGFYFHRQRDVDYNYRSSQPFLDALGMSVSLPDEYYQRFQSYFISEEQALFGELTYRFTEDFWVTGGLRYGSTETQGFTRAGGYNSNYLTNALFGIPGPLTITPVPAATGVPATQEGPSYRFSASWRPVPNITTYAAVATGFRTPIVNARAGAVSALDPNDIIIPDGADSNDLVSYEAGIKGSWFNNRLFANLAVYHINWNDIQVQANRVSDSVQFATNIGGARSQGIEFELMARATDNLTISLNGSLNEAKVTSLTPEEAAISGAVEGARLAGPRFQASMLVNYNFDLMANAEGNASLAVYHVGSFPGSFPNVPGQPGVVSPTFGYTEAHTVANATIAAAFERFTVGAYVENIFDDDSINYVHPEAFISNRFGVVRPRTIGVRVGYSF
ncbi:TonB-dependent receptor [Glycocaulis abyssi]|uniref:TonB-dependent receptor n=2 Tax=Glycocaulis abyssi TaxID=1433403 RepID=A0ABV9NG42_9PROT